MSTVSQFSGGRKIAAITNFCSAGGVAVAVPNGSGSLSPAGINGKRALSGALTAATLATALSITGRGALNFAAVGTEDTTARTVRLKVTIDGVSIFDATSSSVTAANQGLIGVGAIYVGSTGTLQPVRFYTSCLVQIASSLTETDKISSVVNYEVDA